jgi:hypothetical protein
VLTTGAIEQLDGFTVSLLGLGASRRRPNFLDCRPQLTPLGAVPQRAGTGLSHALLGGPDFRHNHLGLSVVSGRGTRCGNGPKNRPERSQGQAESRFDFDFPGV